MYCKTNLFCNTDIIPLSSMSLGEQMNAYIRFIIIVFLMLLIITSNTKSSFIFLFLSLLFIIIIYYIQKNTMKHKEYYKNIQNGQNKQNKQNNQYKITGNTCGIRYNSYKSNSSTDSSLDCNRLNNLRNPINNINNSRSRLCKDNGVISLSQVANGNTATPASTLLCNDNKLFNFHDPNYVSLNQRLAGPANPKTKIAPVIVPPPAALDYWRANNLINHSHINTESQTDTYLSGYQVSNCCDNNSSQNTHGSLVEGYEGDYMYEGITDEFSPVKKPCEPSQRSVIAPTPSVTKPLSYTVGGQNGLREEYSDTIRDRSKSNYEGYSNANFSCNKNTDSRCPLSNIHLQHVEIQAPQPSVSVPNLQNIQGGLQENFEYPHVRSNESGWINTMCGYNPGQIKDFNLPSNLAVGNCEKDIRMKEYNKNIFTHTIQPDIFTRSEIIEPINSNMGISYTQQFPPVTSSIDKNGLTFIEHDPRLYNPKKHTELNMGVTEADVYDPRFNGYGTSYRSYTDDNIGQTRFYYDDIDSVRRPNYISRSNIDFAKYADSYGPLTNKNEFGNSNTNSIREMAQNSFLESSLQQRTELQERLMRKRNSELWQLRKYPMHTRG